MADLDLEDLLGRDSVRLDAEAVRGKLGGQTILVTGAGGSIGSELCRRMACFGAKAIVGFDIAENAIFELQQEMPGHSFHPEIGSIQDGRRVCEVIRKHRPSIVYHAAAHKHVPLMESHIFQAVENNVLGTCTVLEAAAAGGVQDFVLISSDKAVRPTSVMGATKRMAELLAASMPEAPIRTASVRFGNVLGSNGSVVPLFRRQIAAGGPITVTDPAMERYFMTITEAVLLVLQASAMSEGRETFVLDLGKAINIVDLARELIRRSALPSSHSIQIVFTGIRPGEKLFEELNSDDERLLATSHEKIRVLAETATTVSEPLSHVKRLRRLCEERDLTGLLDAIRALVPDFSGGR